MNCETCGKDNAIFRDIKHRAFCDDKCAFDYVPTEKVIHTTSQIGSGPITASEMQTIEGSEKELLNVLEASIPIGNDELVFQMTHEKLIQHLQNMERQKQELQIRARITHARINKLMQLGEGQRVERYRKLGVNSDIEGKAKVRGEIQKLIARYRKEGFKDSGIRSMLIDDMEFEKEKVEKAFMELN
jgi:hypothetical protein